MYKEFRAIILATVSIAWTILLGLVVLSAEELINDPTDYSHDKMVSFACIFITWSVLVIFSFKFIRD
jgi:uncharacterized SAM-binding protein YcdF (DUF218 family)